MSPDGILAALVAIGLALAGAIVRHGNKSERAAGQLASGLTGLTHSVDKLDATVQRLDAKLDDHGERIATLEERTRPL